MILNFNHTLLLLRIASSEQSHVKYFRFHNLWHAQESFKEVIKKNRIYMWNIRKKIVGDLTFSLFYEYAYKISANSFEPIISDVLAVFIYN